MAGRVRSVTESAVSPRDGEFLTLDEIHAAALENLPADVAVYLESGSGTEQTLRANREAFGRHVIKPKPMSGVNDPKTNTEFLGIPLSLGDPDITPSGAAQDVLAALRELLRPEHP